MTKTWVTLSLMAALAVGILAVTPATGEAQTLTPGDHAMTMEFGGLTRQYIVHVPPAGSGDTALPVLMVFHGGGQNDAKMQAYALIDTTADAEGLVTVYVSGTESGHGNRIEFWNSGFCCGYPYDNNVDDVGFSAAIIESLKTQINMDADRVYATGISNGGMMTYRNICERADLYAAAVIVEGAMDLTTTCSPSRSLPLMIVHATNDQNIPYDGGVGPNSKSHIDNTSVDSTVDAWKTINNCTGDGTTTTQSGLSTDVTQVERWV
ncbi:prolyl oligopeptidase family serine peptidase, partial [bacterium]|nr:prolyl oligopeptidase family serine peptidase [bacterium]